MNSVCAAASMKRSAANGCTADASVPSSQPKISRRCGLAAIVVAAPEGAISPT
jgi:hypothetical protein